MSTEKSWPASWHIDLAAYEVTAIVVCSICLRSSPFRWNCPLHVIYLDPHLKVSTSSLMRSLQCYTLLWRSLELSIHWMEIIYLFSLYFTFLYFSSRLASPWASDNVIITTEAKGWAALQHIWVPSAWTLQQSNELSKSQKCQIDLQKPTSIVNIESQEPVFKHLAYLRLLTYFPGLTLHGLVFGHRFIIMAPPAEGSNFPQNSYQRPHCTCSSCKTSHPQDWNEISKTTDSGSSCWRRL